MNQGSPQLTVALFFFSFFTAQLMIYRVNTVHRHLSFLSVFFFPPNQLTLHLIIDSKITLSCLMTENKLCCHAAQSYFQCALHYSYQHLQYSAFIPNPPASFYSGCVASYHSMLLNNLVSVNYSVSVWRRQQ